MIKLTLTSPLISLGRVPNFSVTVVNDMFHKNSESNVNCSKTVAIGVSGGRQTTHHTPTGFIPDCYLDEIGNKSYSCSAKNSEKQVPYEIEKGHAMQQWLILLKMECELGSAPPILQQLEPEELLPILQQLMPLPQNELQSETEPSSHDLDGQQIGVMV